MKANHNNYVLDKLIEELFPMVQRYRNESKSQRVCVSVCICFPKIVNLNKTLSDFPTILYLYTLFFIHEY